jgi:hypothetical protein
MQERVINLLGRSGPLTGADLLRELGGDSFALWKTCMTSPRLTTRRVGRRYVRLDRRIDGYARLSPSILREFLTYSVVGLAEDPTAVEAHAEQLHAHIREISRIKHALAARVVADVVAPLAPDAASASEARRGPGSDVPFCVVVAGDIVYGMSHDKHRPERSTGTMVNGSDLDIVILVDDDAPADLDTRLDDAMYQKKYQFLKNPAFREEIDYIVKRFDTLREQTGFDTFKRMVACKIFDEAQLLFGSPELFAAGKDLLAERGVVDRLRAMERDAVRDREQQEQYLLDTGRRYLQDEDLFLFYTSEESEEFE